MKKKLLKGFTLVELIVVMILMGIITTAVVMVMRPAQSIYTNITNKAFEEQSALIVSKMINQELRYSTGIRVICNHVDQNDDGTDKKETYPSVGAIGDFKHYIKLSNDFREYNKGNYNMYLKGARGSFEKGTVESGAIKKSASSITNKTFDDHDFQFSVEGYNNKPGQESLSIGIKCNFLREGKQEEKDAAATVKPNPDFVPMYEKVYIYSETFEFINLKNSAMIGKKTDGLALTDEYEYGTPVDKLGDSRAPYYDPREAGKDNTIWIFYNLPEEAADKDKSDPTTTTLGSETSASTVSIKEETTPVSTKATINTKVTFDPDKKALAGHDKMIDGFVNNSDGSVTFDMMKLKWGGDVDYEIQVNVKVDEEGNVHLIITDATWNYPSTLKQVLDPKLFPDLNKGADYKINDEQREYLQKQWDIDPWTGMHLMDYGFGSSTESTTPPETTPSETSPSETKSPETSASETSASETKPSETSASETETSVVEGEPVISVSTSDNEKTTWEKPVYKLKVKISNTSSVDSGPVTVKIKMNGDISSTADNITDYSGKSSYSISGDTLTYVTNSGLKAGESWTLRNDQVIVIVSNGKEGFDVVSVNATASKA